MIQDKMKKFLQDKKVSRRNFMQQAIAAGVSVAAAEAMWTRSARAAEPKRGGRLRQGLHGGATSDSLRGAALLDAHNINSSWQIRNCLVEVDANGDVGGELAESWEASDDAKQWVFKLRKGVEFHNGKSLEAEDVVFSINDHRGPDAQTGASGVVSGIADIKADGKETVIFDLNEGNADFPFLMSDYHLTVAPAGTAPTEWDKGVGTGPFILTQWDPGVRSASKRNPNYFKEGRPYFAEVETLNIADLAARSAALQTNEVDVISEPDLKTLHLLARNPNVKVLEVGGTKHYSIPMNTTIAPFDDNNVRMALKHAVDRETMLQTILQGHGYVGNDHPIGSGQRYFASELEQRPYDPEKAKWYLKQAGLENLSVQLYAGDIYPNAVNAAVLFQEHAKKAGIDIEVVRVPADGYWSDVWLKKPWCMVYWSGRATEDWMFSTAYAEGSDWNDSFWEHARFNELLVAARAELDQNKRRDMYVEMQTIVRDEGGVVIPMFANWVMGTSDAVATPEKIAGNWVLDGEKNHERWWFA